MADGGLDLTPDQMRELGYAAVDTVIEHLTTLRDGPTFTPPPPDLTERIVEPAPEDGSDPVELLGWLRSEVLAAGVRNHHPGMFAFIPVAPTFPGVVADMLAAGMNVFAGSFQSGPGASVVELEVLAWFRELLGLTPTAEGVIASGGSTANLVGLAVGRDRRQDGGSMRVAYTTTETHSSVGRALKLLGMERVREVAIDERFRMRPDSLAQAMAEDAATGLTPWCVIAAAGTTNTGAVDDLPALRAVADVHGAWLHVDAA